MCVCVSDRLMMRATPDQHVLTLLGEGLKECVTRVPSDISELQEALPDLLHDLRSVCEVLQSMNLSKPDAFALCELLMAAAEIFQCCFADESKRPSATVARAGRRLVYVRATTKGASLVLAGFAKVLLTYKGGKLAFDVSKAHSQVGLEDYTIDQFFAALVGDFEGRFEEAFDDVGRWLLGDVGDEPTLQIMTARAEPLLAMVATFMSSVTRWSAAAAERKLEAIFALTSNMTDLVGASLAFMARLVSSRFSVTKWWMSAEVSASDDAGPGIAAEGQGVAAAEATESNVGAGAMAMSQDTDIVLKTDCAADEITFIGSPILRSRLSMMKTDVEALADVCKQVCDSLDKTLRTLGKKCGESIWQRFPLEQHPNVYSEEASVNMKRIAEMLDYIIACSEVAERNATNVTDEAAGEGYSASLIKFSRLHHHQASSPAADLHCCSAALGDVSFAARISKRFRSLV